MEVDFKETNTSVHYTERFKVSSASITYNIENNKSNSVYSLVISVIYITSINKIRFWLQVAYPDPRGFFSKHSKNSLAFG